MLHVAILNWREGLSAEQRDGALARRAAWSYPEGARVVGEYWIGAGSPAVISVFDAESFDPIFEITATWGDVFDVTVLPATTPEDGLKAGPDIIARAAASRQG